MSQSFPHKIIQAFHHAPLEQAPSQPLTCVQPSSTLFMTSTSSGKLYMHPACCSPPSRNCLTRDKILASPASLSSACALRPVWEIAQHPTELPSEILLNCGRKSPRCTIHSTIRDRSIRLAPLTPHRALLCTSFATQTPPKFHLTVRRCEQVPVKDKALTQDARGKYVARSAGQNSCPPDNIEPRTVPAWTDYTPLSWEAILPLLPG